MAHHPAQNYIDAIRTSLWKGHQFGEAAVMIGSGMSLNAERKVSSAPPFPTWARLMDPFLRRLYPTPADVAARQQREAMVGATSEALRIASEFVSAEGEGGLNSLLKTAIPDDSYLPSDLHIRLVKLRWADVFTTNWDTLLERAADELSVRRYNVVRCMQDIPICRQPRITKLHGSFPSNAPFILTEDHFRKYPRDFAPFVNMVRQSIVENTLCMIGFSGNDPNFLQWTGWVRDNLGDHTRYIYLVTLEPLRREQVNLLRDRRIHVIDLSDVFPSDEPDQFKKTLEWFLINLEAGRIADPDKWPDVTVSPPEPAIRNLARCRYEITDIRNARVLP